MTALTLASERSPGKSKNLASEVLSAVDFAKKGIVGPKSGDLLASQQISLAEFSRLKITTLRDAKVVRRYRTMWVQPRNTAMVLAV
jgi:hypothetical protein